MKEFKVYARAGQGAITTAAILGEALFIEDRYAYAFPHFGAARMGAPMNAFLRFDNKPIRMRSQIYNPDYAIIVDPSLIWSENCLATIKEGGVAIVNYMGDLEVPQGVTVHQVPADEIAMEVIGKPYSNTVLLGAFSKATGEVALDSLLKAVEDRFITKKPEVLDQNLKAVRRGFEAIK
ncbi:MAG: 2-oxoacid:acceptor oxidoreductase family protein [Chlamydiota bacterium]